MQIYCIVIKRIFFLNVNSRLIVTGVHYTNIAGSDVCPDLDYRHLLHHHSDSGLAEVLIHSVLSEK